MGIYGNTHGKAQTKTMTRRPRSAKYTTAPFVAVNAIENCKVRSVWINLLLWLSVLNHLMSPSQMAFCHKIVLRRLRY